MKLSASPQSNTYSSLLSKTKKIAYLQGINSLLSWDQETMMPEKASEARGEQIAHLAGIIHSLETDPELWNLVVQCYDTEIKKAPQEGKIDPSSLSDAGVVALRLKRDLEKARKLPQEFVELFARTTSESMVVWQKAKSENNWKLFEPYLQKVVELCRQKATYLRESENDDLYATLVDEYEPEADLKTIDQFFAELRKELVPLSRKIVALQKNKWGEKPKEPVFPLDQQMMMSKDIITVMGYDWSKSRLDGSSHPFSNAPHPTDSRITIRKGANEGIISQLMSALHEAGHSLYEMGLPLEHYGTPLCQAVSLSVHESQSRLWETVIGRSHSFMKHLLKVINSVSTNKLDQETLYRMVNWVEPSFIRTEADEVTYPLHVMLRYEIEKELISGSLQVKDVPRRWNEMMQDLLGVTPPNDKLGCLQDIHWSMGMFGYFPTYTLGSWYAICLFHAMKSEHPSLVSEIERGDFSFTHSWLKQHIWSHGRRYLSQDLMKKALKREPQALDYIAYLRDKYLA